MLFLITALMTVWLKMQRRLRERDVGIMKCHLRAHAKYKFQKLFPLA